MPRRFTAVCFALACAAALYLPARLQAAQVPQEMWGCEANCLWGNCGAKGWGCACYCDHNLPVCDCTEST